MAKGQIPPGLADAIARRSKKKKGKGNPFTKGKMDAEGPADEKQDAKPGQNDDAKKGKGGMNPGFAKYLANKK